MKPTALKYLVTKEAKVTRENYKDSDRKPSFGRDLSAGPQNQTLSSLTVFPETVEEKTGLTVEHPAIVVKTNRVLFKYPHSFHMASRKHKHSLHPQKMQGLWRKEPPVQPPGQGRSQDWVLVSNPFPAGTASGFKYPHLGVRGSI